MTPEKRNAVIYVVAGVLWPGLISLLVVTLVEIPVEMQSLGGWLVMWFALLIWPSLFAGLEGIKRGKPWHGYKRARWFFWLSFVLSPLIWPFVFI